MLRSAFFVAIIACLAFLCVPVSNAEDAGNNAQPTHRTFKHIMIVILENQEFWSSNLNVHLSALNKQGTLLTNYRAPTHPSQPNYIAIVGGDTLGVNSNGDHDVEGKSLVDLMEDKGVSWKTYQEDYPGGCFAGSQGKYKRKHNPFISFNTIRNDPDRCAKIVNSDELWNDLKSDSLPQFSFYTPNMDNSGHDAGLAHAGKWASAFVHKLMEHPAIKDDTLFVLTYDEGFYIGPNKVYTLLIGPDVPKNNMDDTKYTHYSLLRTIEENFGLANLGRKDVGAVVFKYRDLPPAFILSLPVFISIVVIGGLVFISIITISAICIRKSVVRRRLIKNSFATLNELEAQASVDSNKEQKEGCGADA